RARLDTVAGVAVVAGERRSRDAAASRRVARLHAIADVAVAAHDWRPRTAQPAHAGLGSVARVAVVALRAGGARRRAGVGLEDVRRRLAEQRGGGPASGGVVEDVELADARAAADQVARRGHRDEPLTETRADRSAHRAAPGELVERAGRAIEREQARADGAVLERVTGAHERHAIARGIDGRGGALSELPAHADVLHAPYQRC